jgi:hypothetical protein
MEYLMTYGWSILVIAVVVAVLFGFGVFNPSSSGSTSSCVALSGWQCTSLTLYSSGTLSLNIGEIGPPITITGVGCSSNSTLPTYFTTASSTVSSGQVASLGTWCPVQSSVLGTSFSGQVWVQYYYNSNPSATYNVVVANIRTPVTETGGLPKGDPYVPITVTNTNTIAGTGSNFQQMISFNPTQSSAYTANEATDLGNIRFYSGITELYSWCESGCNSITSSNAVFWVTLPSGIGASGSTTVSMYFLPNTAEYDGVYAGEAPQLTCTNPTNPAVCGVGGTYGKYDNGAQVFDDYWNFAGDGAGAFPSGWTHSVTGSSTYTVANGVTTTPLGGGSNYAFVETSASYFPNTNIILDAFSTMPPGLGYGWMGLAGGGGDTWVSTVYCSSSTVLCTFSNGVFTSAGLTTYPNMLSIYEPGSTATSMFYYNYIAATGQKTSTGGNIYAGSQYTSGAGGSVTVEYFRVRAYPPGGVMPSVSFGSITH